MRTVLIDNHDSYTFNLFHLLAEVDGAEPVVVCNDEADWAGILALAPDAVVVSPGPGRPEHPRDVGVSLAAVAQGDVPVLGVCLGHQALAYAAGGTVIHAREVVHGGRSAIEHDGSGLFAGLPPGFRAVRYHSLAVGAVPPVLRVTARTPDGVVMGLAHRTRPLWGVQFHPESVATEHGHALVANFLALAAARRPAQAAHRPAPAPPPPRPAVAPSSPVTLHHRTLPGWTEPEAAFAALHAGDEHVAWLDSARVEPGRARFSYLAAPGGPLGRVLRYDVAAGEVAVEHAGGREVRREPVLETCRRLLAETRCDAPGLPFDFVGGLVGYLGYELKADCGAPRAHVSEQPDAALLFCDRVVAFDHLEHRVHLLALAAPGGEGEAAAWMAATARRLAGAAGTALPSAAPPGELRFTLRDDPATYLANIAACRRQIFEGETYEICLTTELRSPDALEPVGAYRALRARNPAAHAALLRLGELSVLSSSPERFLRVSRNRVVESGPIKGTAARLADPGQDAVVAARLRRDPKSRAENLMIADLVRNDLGRVCAAGTVTVPRLMGVDTLATVHQLVTTVRGRLRPEADALDAVRAAFPGGSMTGAPKLRTMEILDVLEDRPRGVYAGALGFLSVNGTADLSIVIRTLVVTPDGVRAGSGGAIVAGSDPEAELAEMLLKARPLLAAVGGRLAGAAPAATAR